MNINAVFPIIFVAVIIVFVAIARSRSMKKMHYDERQLLARNSAYKISFFFLLMYCFTCGVFRLFDVKWADAALQMFLGIVISFVMFIALCILKDAYFSDSPKQNYQAVLSFFVYGILFFMYLMIYLKDGEVFWNNGELTLLVLYLVSSVCFIALGILSAFKIISDKRGAEK